VLSDRGKMTSGSITALAMLTMGDDLPPAEVVFGRSASMRAVREKLERVAKVNVPVLILGESGTGKEIIAKLIHRLSPWSLGPFVKVTCPAIPGTLMESELFGYEKGAFTGAYGLKRGRVEAAHQGTLFLDEIGELEFGLQAKLLQLLQDGTYSRIGGQTEKLVEMRVVSASNRHLGTEIENGRFRQDLLHRINGMSIHMPALRERLEDIPEIADYLLKVYNCKFKTSAARFSSSFLSCLQQRQWPGNIRELENVVRRYAILGWDNRDILRELAEDPAPPVYLNIPTGEKVQLKELTQQAIRQIEETVIRTVLARNNANRKITAAALGISYRMLLYKLRDMDVPSVRRSRLAMDNARAADAE
jgi:two-component system response regulator AtoC